MTAARVRFPRRKATRPRIPGRELREERAVCEARREVRAGPLHGTHPQAPTSRRCCGQRSRGHGVPRARTPGRVETVSDVEIGRAKRARRVYAFDDIAIVPNRRTRDPQDVSVNWGIDAYQFSIPFLALHQQQP